MGGEMSDWATWINTGVAVTALIVSAFALMSSHKAQTRANAAQAKLLEIEERREQDRLAESQRAELRPDLRESGRSHRLYLVNQGGAEARNIHVTLDGLAIEKHEAAVRGSPMPAFVGPESEIGCLLAFHTNCAPPFEIEITWDDDSASNRSFRTTLTI